MCKGVPLRVTKAISCSQNTKCCIFFYWQISFCCLISSALFLLLNPLTFLFFYLFFNCFGVIWEKLVSVVVDSQRGSSFWALLDCWRGSWLNLPMPFLSFFKFQYPQLSLHIVQLHTSCLCSLSSHWHCCCCRTSPAESHLLDFLRIIARATSLFFSTSCPVNILTDLWSSKNLGMCVTMMCIYGVTQALSYPSLLPLRLTKREIHSLAFMKNSVGSFSRFWSLRIL